MKATPPRTLSRIKFTKDVLDRRRGVRPHRQEVLWDTDTTGLQVLISRGPVHKRQATLTFRVVFYLPDKPGKPHYHRIGRYPDISIEEARNRAKRIRLDAAEEGIDPKRVRLTGDFNTMIDEYIEDHGKAKQKSWQETERILNLYVVQKWGDRMVESLNWQDDIRPHLSEIARGEYKPTSEHGKLGTPAVALSVRTHLTVFYNWYVDAHARDKDFRSPIVPSVLTKEWRREPRERCLSDAELRLLWQACDELGDKDVYAAVVKTALLTAQRFRKVAALQRSEIKPFVRIESYVENDEEIPAVDIPNVWDGTRNAPKNKQVSVVPLPDLALKIIAKVPRIAADRGKDFVFTTTGRSPLRGWSKYKARLDRKILEILKREGKARGDDPDTVQLTPWQHRDLRRTARTVMAPLGISDTVAEHCLAHSQPKIQKTYNTHQYLPEKREAFRKLAAHIASVTRQSPAGSNVHKLRAV